jgi:hypothetical protein
MCVCVCLCVCVCVYVCVCVCVCVIGLNERASSPSLGVHPQVNRINDRPPTMPHAGTLQQTSITIGYRGCVYPDVSQADYRTWGTTDSWFPTYMFVLWCNRLSFM